MAISAQTIKEIQCEFCDEFHQVHEYEDADPDDPDSLFSPIYCPNCGEGFMAMGVTPRVHLR